MIKESMSQKYNGITIYVSKKDSGEVISYSAIVRRPPLNEYDKGRKHLTARSRKELIKKIDEYKKEKTIVKRALDFTTAWDMWVENSKHLEIIKSPASIRKRKNAFNSFEFFYGRNISDITTAHVIKWFDLNRNRKTKNGQGTLSDNSLINYKSYLASFFWWCYNNQYMAAMPDFNKLPKLKPKDKEIRIYKSREEFNKVFQYIDDDEMKMLYALCFYAGLRRSEAYAIKISDLIKQTADGITYYILDVNEKAEYTPTHSHEEYKQLRKERQKSGSKEQIASGYRYSKTMKTIAGKRKTLAIEPLPQMIREYAATHKLDRKGHLLPLNHFNSISTKQQRIVRKVKVQDPTLKVLGIHELRKSYISLLFEANIPLEATAEFVGHDNISVTKKYYLKFTDKVYSDAAKKIAAMHQEDKKSDSFL